MNRVTAALIVFMHSLVILIPAISQEPYDKAAVVQVMRTAQGLLPGIKPAITKNDFFAAASNFWKFAEGMERLQRFKPPKGDPALWTKTLDDFVSAAMRGVGACGEKDAKKASAALAELQTLMASGHRVFR